MANIKPQAVYMDSCVLIDVLGKIAPHVDHVRPIIDDAENADVTIAASVLCVAECGSSAKKGGNVKQDEIDKFFSQYYFEFCSLTQSLARAARSIAFTHGVKPMDAIHLATCLECGVGYFLTRDGEPDNPKNKRKKNLLRLDKKLKIKNEPLRIVTPEMYRSIVYGYTLGFMREK